MAAGGKAVPERRERLSVLIRAIIGLQWKCFHHLIILQMPDSFKVSGVFGMFFIIEKGLPHFFRRPRSGHHGKNKTANRSHADARRTAMAAERNKFPFPHIWGRRNRSSAFF